MAVDGSGWHRNRRASKGDMKVKVIIWPDSADSYRMHETSAESILTLKNCESIHFGFFSQRLSEKESIHDT